MFNKRVFGDSLPDNNGVITEVWDQSTTATDGVRLFAVPPASRRDQMREMRTLKRDLLQRLKTSGPPKSDRSITAVVDYDASFGYVRNAYRQRDLDTLRAINKFFGYCEMQYVLHAVAAMRSIGYQAAAEMLDDEYLDITRKVREALATENISAATSTRYMSMDELAELKRQAVMFAFTDPSATDRIIYLITDRGVVDVDELRQYLDGMDGIGSALIDGSL